MAWLYLCSQRKPPSSNVHYLCQGTDICASCTPWQVVSTAVCMGAVECLALLVVAHQLVNNVMQLPVPFGSVTCKALKGEHLFAR